MTMNSIWTTAEGEGKKMKDLTESHLQNILIDGYRAEIVTREAKRRKMEIPEYADYQDYLHFIESCASCAIEGNDYGEAILKADRDKDYEVVWVHVNRMKNKNFYEKTEKPITTTEKKD